VAGGKAKKSPIITRSRAAKGEDVVCGNPPSVTKIRDYHDLYSN